MPSPDPITTTSPLFPTSAPTSLPPPTLLTSLTNHPALLSFFTNHHYYRTDRTLASEAYLFFTPTSPPFSRLYLIPPILLIQMCVGSLYSFSIFNSKLDEVWGTPGANASAYLLCIAFYGLTTLLLGVWIERNGPRRSSALTLLLCPLGWGCASLGSYLHSQPLESLFLLHGIGAAFAYLSLTSCLSRWFSEFKGLFTGIAVMGVGFGSYVWTSLGKALLDPAGPYRYEVWRVQGSFALAILLVVGCCTPLLRDPPPGYTPPTDSFSAEVSWRGALLRALRSAPLAKPSTPPPSFLSCLCSLEMLLLAGVFFCSEITGLVFLSSASDMVQNTFRLSLSDSISVTSYLNLSNFLGRVLWGLASDKLGRRPFFLLSCATQAFATGLQAVWIAQGNYPGWLASFLLTGSLYGGGFGVIPALCSDLFGPHISAATHGVMIGVWASAAVVGIPIFAATTARYSEVVVVVGGGGSPVRTPTPQAYIVNSLWLCALPVAGLLLALCLSVHPQDIAARKEQGGVRARLLGGWVLCISCKGVVAKREPLVD